MSRAPVSERRRCIPIGEWPIADQASWKSASRPGTGSTTKLRVNSWALNTVQDRKRLWPLVRVPRVEWSAGSERPPLPR